MKRVALLACLVALCGSPAEAQTDVCMDANGNVDQTATEGWRGFLGNADAQLMQQLVGVWYTEIPSPNTGQIAYRYQTLEPTGLFTMQTRVCDSMGLCSDYPAQGAWAAQGGGGGMFTMMTIVSDTQVTNLCGMTQVMMASPTVMQTQSGQNWQRVQ